MTPQTEPIEWGKFAWEMTKGIAMALAAIFSFAANQQSSHNAEALSALKFNADTQAQRAELDIKVYELVEKALSAEGPAAKGHGVAAAALINALTMPPLRSQLLNALSAGTQDPELKKQLDEMQRFDDQDVQPGASPAAAGPPGRGLSRLIDLFVAPVHAQGLPGLLKGYRIDIFYCEGQKGVTDARQKHAQIASDTLKPAGTAITVKVRNLPTFVQARPEFKSVADEIEFNDAKEVDAARFLAAAIGIRPDAVRRFDTKTPGYLKVFYCGS